MIENINVFHLFHLGEITDPLQTVSDLCPSCVFLRLVNKEKLRH